MSLLGIPFSFRGVPEFFFPLYLLLPYSGESAISSERAGVTGRLTSLYRWGQGQVSSQDSPERRGPGLGLPWDLHTLTPFMACPHLWLPPLSPRRTKDALEVTSLFARTLSSPQGVSYPLQEPLSSGQWLMKPVWRQVLMRSLRLVWSPFLHS